MCVVIRKGLETCRYRSQSFIGVGLLLTRWYLRPCSFHHPQGDQRGGPVKARRQDAEGHCRRWPQGALGARVLPRAGGRVAVLCQDRGECSFIEQDNIVAVEAHPVGVLGRPVFRGRAQGG